MNIFSKTAMQEEKKILKKINSPIELQTSTISLLIESLESLFFIIWPELFYSKQSSFYYKRVCFFFSVDRKSYHPVFKDFLKTHIFLSTPF